ncbi:MAG: adenylosuccinate synthase [bacterium]
MSVTVLVGLGWGDEGKGRVIDFLAPAHHIIVRFNGGANAGHTVVVDGVTFRFHLLPSGMLYPEKTCVIAHGVVLDPARLVEELAEVRRTKPNLARLLISDRCHLVLPVHKQLDLLEEAFRGGGKLGTTGQGIGPVYEDKVARKGIRICDLYSPLLLEKIERFLAEKNKILVDIYKEEPVNPRSLQQQLLTFAQFVQPFLVDTLLFLQERLHHGASILMEGAQGALLDHEIGTYPFVTSTSPMAGMVSLGAGIGPKQIDRIVGVVKAYATRVGTGPFPTELRNEIGEGMRQRGREFGTTTGRPRRCGWFDLPLIQYALSANSPDELVLTKLDVLSGLEHLQICVGYHKSNLPIKGIPALAEELDQCIPVYQTMPGWREELSGIRRFTDLPKNAIQFIHFLESYLKVPIRSVSIGPQREEMLLV